MYVKPFSEVNNLKRLVRMSGYRAYISVDEILSVILEDWPGMVRLDAHLAHPDRNDQMFKFDFCSTAKELTDRLDRETLEAPVFVYSQPQNLHIRVLAGDEYPAVTRQRTGSTGFFKPAVEALRHIDGCFGDLIDYLKRRHVYDDSIVVLTSDHGDAYGEAGRWGHAFYLAPEILRIPLIIHLPRSLRESISWDPEAIALLTDVTPTLYDLLGFRPASHSDLVGRSLLRRTTDDRPPLPGGFLVQSSYSRVFGLLDPDGRRLYTADANHNREQLFDLQGGPEGTALVNADRVRYRKWLLERLRGLGAYYGRLVDD
jgi:hypothetical protein